MERTRNLSVEGIEWVIFLVIVLPWMPESPRFFLSTGQPEKARAILATYHANGSLDDELVNFEIDEIMSSLEMEKRYEGAGQHKAKQQQARDRVGHNQQPTSHTDGARFLLGSEPGECAREQK